MVSQNPLAGAINTTWLQLAMGNDALTNGKVKFSEKSIPWLYELPDIR